MIFYILIFIIIAMIFQSTIAGRKGYHNPNTLAWIMGFLAVFVGISDMLGGYDRYIYCELFDSMAFDVRHGIHPLSVESAIYNQYGSEIVYVLWNDLIAHVTQNRYMFVLLTTMLMYVFIYKNIRDYVDNYPFAVILFLALWFFFTFTYFRQVMAACVVWYSYRFVIQRKKWKFFLCAIIAYKLHNSAIIFFPFYFMPLKKYPKEKVKKIMLFLFLLGVTGAPMLLYNMYGETVSENRIAQSDLESTGARAAYVIEVVLFLYFILQRYDRIREDDTKTMVFLNATLCFCGVLLVFVRSVNAGRQSWYFMIGVIYILSYLATDKTKVVDKYATQLLLVSFFLYFRIISAWGVQLSPYKTFFSDGFRQGDNIIGPMEYDWKYEDDKMYKPMVDFYFENWY